MLATRPPPPITCENGIAKTGAPSGTSNVVACASCNPGFKLMAPSGGAIGDDGTTCVADSAVYTCENGIAKTGTPSGTSNVVACASCNPGFKLMVPLAEALLEMTVPPVWQRAPRSIPVKTVRL